MLGYSVPVFALSVCRASLTLWECFFRSSHTGPTFGSAVKILFGVPKFESQSSPDFSFLANTHPGRKQVVQGFGFLPPMCETNTEFLVPWPVLRHLGSESGIGRSSECLCVSLSLLLCLLDNKNSKNTTRCGPALSLALHWVKQL